MRAWIALAALLTLAANAETILVKPSTNAAACAAFHSSQGTAWTKFKHIQWEMIHIPGGQEKRITKNYENSPLFIKVQRQILYQAVAVPNDPLFPKMWAHWRIQSTSAWERVTNSGVIAIVDSGIDFRHPDLAANLWNGPAGEHGYTATGGVLTPGGYDDNGHGTHVAGIIGAAGNNGLGIVGITWRTKLLPLKFLDSSGSGYTADAILCIEKLIDLRLSGEGVRVVNHSWAALGRDEALQDAFSAAEKAGILSICASANAAANLDEFPFIPAAFTNEGIVSVNASGVDDTLAFFSNYGIVSTDLMAPGFGVLSCRTNGEYGLLSGTSMAAPHVSGVCAAMFALNPQLTPLECKSVLLDPDSLDRPSASVPYSSTLGGRLNFNKCVNNPKLFHPPINHVPSISVSPGMTCIAPRNSSEIQFSVADQDGDVVHSFLSMRPAHPIDALLVGDRYTVSLNQGHPVVTNAPIGIDVALSVRVDVTDGRGASASTPIEVFLSRDESKVRALPLPELTFSNDPPRLHCQSSVRNAIWSYIMLLEGGGGYDGGGMFYQANTETRIPVPLAYGANVFRAQLVDEDGNIANSEQLVVYTAQSSVVIPKIDVRVSASRAVSPFNVTADLSHSTGNIMWYLVRGWQEGELLTDDIFDPIMRFQLTKLGFSPALFYVYDPIGKIGDAMVVPLSVTPNNCRQEQPRLSIKRTGQNVVVDWWPSTPQDTLDATENLSVWAAISTGLPPITVPLKDGQRFFRVRTQ